MDVPQTTLTGSITIDRDSKFPKAVNISGGSLTIAGGNTTTTQLLVPAGTLTVVGGDFYQGTVQSTQSFAASGTHRVTLNGSITQHVFFDNLVNSTVHDLRLAELHSHCLRTRGRRSHGLGCVALTAAPLAFNNIRFTTIPTSGAYLRATDTAPSDGNVLTIILVNATPSDGSAATVTAGGAVVNWR